MSRTWSQKGDTVSAIAPSGGIVSGIPLMRGAIFGVPETTAAEGESYALSVVGVHRLPKASGALEPGNIAFWDNSAHAVGATCAGKFAIGVVIEHAGSSNTTCLVRLDGVAATAVAGPWEHSASVI